MQARVANLSVNKFQSPIIDSLEESGTNLQRNQVLQNHVIDITHSRNIFLEFLKTF